MLLGMEAKGTLVSGWSGWETWSEWEGKAGGGYPAPKMVTLVIMGVREEKVCVLYVWRLVVWVVTLQVVRAHWVVSGVRG